MSWALIHSWADGVITAVAGRMISRNSPRMRFSSNSESTRFGQCKVSRTMHPQARSRVFEAAGVGYPLVGMPIAYTHDGPAHRRFAVFHQVAGKSAVAGKQNQVALPGADRIDGDDRLAIGLALVHGLYDQQFAAFHAGVLHGGHR